MERGKEICKILRQIRREIARENDIALVTTECCHKGSCTGTCPKCEEEVRYLEEQLADRKRIGRITRVVGVSVGLAALAPALLAACDPIKGPDIQGDIPAPPAEQATPNN